MVTFFLAGIIQGSITETRIHRQDHRAMIRDAIKRAVPDSQVYCPVTHYPDSLSYDPDKARRVFFELMERAAQADVLVAYVPEASMGTAVEMWQAYRAGRVVLAVTDMTINWAVRFLADRTFPTPDQLERFLGSDSFQALLSSKQATRQEVPDRHG